MIISHLLYWFIGLEVIMYNTIIYNYLTEAEYPILALMNLILLVTIAIAFIWVLFMLLDKCLDLVFKSLSYIFKPIRESTENIFNYLYRRKW